ncbi:MAG: type II secretion system F family protein [Gammaproteobacteria bacterium]|nr:MAG: type II secretion system F family protein [Gammaproteobacteria bacterium]
MDDVRRSRMAKSSGGYHEHRRSHASSRNLIMSLKHYLHHRKQKHSISTRDTALFFRQFATLIAAGVPIIQSCTILEKSQEKTALRLLIYAIKRDILAGKTLSHCLQRYPHYFDPLTVQLIKIGEHTGRLDTMLLIIATHQEKHLAFRKRIQQALFYPVLILITALIITFCMFIFVIPRFAELFQDMQTSLPLLTRLIFYLSAKLRECLFPALALTLVLITLSIRGKYSTPIKRYFQHTFSTLPFIHTTLHKIKLTRFVRYLALTLTAGLPITDALALAGASSQDPSFTTAILQLQSKIRTGLSLHRAMETLPHFPTLMTQMVKVGEESGKLESMLDKLADFFESDIDHLLHHLNQLLEPLIMVVLGVLIGGLVIGMYLPIFKLGSRL